MKKVNRYTRAGYNGRVLICPKCKEEATVYHFAWCGMQCSQCKLMIDKLDWIIKE
jgi:ribosomal protein S27E